MNTDDAINEFRALLQRIIIHDRCVEELYSLIANEIGGHKAEFLAVFLTQLEHIFAFRSKIFMIDSHEKLKGCGLYSIHLQRKQFNIRVIIGFNKNEDPCFLMAFYERSGKAKTDYTNVIDVANARFNELLGGQNE